MLKILTFRSEIIKKKKVRIYFVFFKSYLNCDLFELGQPRKILDPYYFFLINNLYYC